MKMAKIIDKKTERNETQCRLVFYGIYFSFAAIFRMLPIAVALGTKLSEFCASQTPQNKCVGVNKTDGYRVACSGGFHEDYLPEDYPQLQSLMLCHLPTDYFDPTESLQPYSKLVKLTVTNSKIKEIIGEFPEFLQNLKTLNLSHLNLERVKPSTFKYLSSLEVLDLSYNKLHYLQLPTAEYLPKLKQIWLAGHSWFCKHNLFWMLRVSKGLMTFKVMDFNRMTCGDHKYFENPVIPILRMLSDLEKECPSSPPNNCVCTLDHVVNYGMSSSFSLHPLITVDCSYRDLKILPKILPHNTTTLLVQGNQISTVDDLITNRYYARLLDIYLDYNRISSISILEGSQWLAQCRILSIKGNNLTKIPTYALDNAFQRNRNIGLVYLGANPWRCDCLFAPAFQDFLIKYKSFIEDITDIKCSYQQDDEYYMTPIRDLPRNTLCRTSTTDMVNYWDSLNVLLAFLIVVLILKFIYDYVLYKKYGTLPRITILFP
ncbi:Leucine-rich repeat,Leucine-rich repeat domain, L domain-like,Leucine-rich repeat, typical subtype [Cinara cedri]|uniref:Leucine-rich repeat,Leucine-rich repeat domain, L domain-like,Leucine-rich repeat, typical subtype n=1 Tax=Cinara cedri TaxID=506608 RepID=A0A5E4N0S9_9HEMI|nr:Leucine-rich repeat,Leucine-rich repeat domain, L domain-like,Leucine-rich repeat, typical subtype [Cinara cedri]